MRRRGRGGRLRGGCGFGRRAAAVGNDAVDLGIADAGRLEVALEVHQRDLQAAGNRGARSAEHRHLRTRSLGLLNRRPQGLGRVANLFAERFGFLAIELGVQVGFE